MDYGLLSRSELLWLLQGSSAAKAIARAAADELHELYWNKIDKLQQQRQRLAEQIAALDAKDPEQMLLLFDKRARYLKLREKVQKLMDCVEG